MFFSLCLYRVDVWWVFFFFLSTYLLFIYIKLVFFFIVLFRFVFSCNPKGEMNKLTAFAYNWLEKIPRRHIRTDVDMLAQENNPCVPVGVAMCKL